MKVLFSGPYRQNDGWGRSAQDYLQALMRVEDIELESKPVMLSNNIEKDTGKWTEVETADIGKPDVIIQHTLPPLMKKINGAINIGLCHFETINALPKFAGNLSNMDQIWVSTQKEVKTCLPYNKNTVHVPMPLDLDFIDSVQETIEDDRFKGNYIFGYAGSWEERKNIASLIIAYYLAFKEDDNVRLMLKLNPQNGLTPQAFLQWVENLKRTCRMYQTDQYPEILSMLDFVSDVDMLRLQNTIDCFVIPSMGESTCRPLLESLYKDKICICTDGIGCNEDYLNMISVPSTVIPCSIQTPPLPEIYTANERFLKIDILGLSSAMKNVFDQHKQMNYNNKEVIKKFHDYDYVASVINDKLSELCVPTVV